MCSVLGIFVCLNSYNSATCTLQCCPQVFQNLILFQILSSALLPSFLLVFLKLILHRQHLSLIAFVFLYYSLNKLELLFYVNIRRYLRDGKIIFHLLDRTFENFCLLFYICQFVFQLCQTRRGK